MNFIIKGEFNIQKRELHEYARKYLAEDYREYYTYEEVVESYLENYMKSNGRYFKNIEVKEV